MDDATAQTLVRSLYDPLAASGLATARLFVLMVVLPVFSRLGLTGLQRGGVALAMALPLVPALAARLAAGPAPGAAALALLLAKEALVGAILGAVVSVPLWAAQMGGELLDQQRGSAAAGRPDPATGEDEQPTATLFALAGIAVLFHGGMEPLLDGVYRSYAIWSPLDFTPRLAAEAAGAVSGLLGRLMAAGLVIAAPVLVPLMAVEVGLAFLARSAKQLSVPEFGPAVKGVVFAVALPLYGACLVGHLREGLAPLLDLAADLGAFAR